MAAVQKKTAGYGYRTEKRAKTEGRHEIDGHDEQQRQADEKKVSLEGTYKVFDGRKLSGEIHDGAHCVERRSTGSAH